MKHTPIGYPSIIFTFGLIVKPIKEVGGVLVQQVLFGFWVDNQILSIMNSLMTQRDIVLKFVCLCINGVNTFQGLKSKMTIQI
jgi:hypothetical protein